MRPVLLIGSRHNAHLHLLSRQISKAHALLISSDGKVYVRDLASRTHVYVNGQEVREADLVDGDLLKVGSFTFKFQAAAGAKQRPAVDSTPAGQLDVDGGEFPITIDQRVLLIGRRPSSDISLVEDSCSTGHAVVFSMGGKRYVRDLGSRTGTIVNGKPVRQQEINFGDVIHIGDTDIHYNAAAEPVVGGSPSGIDELEDLVGTAPLAIEDLHSHQEPELVTSSEPPLELDFEPQPIETPAQDVFPASVPAAPVAEPAPAANEPALHMLIGDNLLSEKLSSSATGAGMQAAAREALEMAKKHDEEAAAPIPLDITDDAIPLAAEPEVRVPPAQAAEIAVPADTLEIQPEPVAEPPAVEPSSSEPVVVNELPLEFGSPETSETAEQDAIPVAETAEELPPAEPVSVVAPFTAEAEVFPLNAAEEPSAVAEEPIEITHAEAEASVADEPAETSEELTTPAETAATFDPSAAEAEVFSTVAHSPAEEPLPAPIDEAVEITHSEPEPPVQSESAEIIDDLPVTAEPIEETATAFNLPTVEPEAFTYVAEVPPPTPAYEHVEAVEQDAMPEPLEISEPIAKLPSIFAGKHVEAVEHELIPEPLEVPAIEQPTVAETEIFPPAALKQDAIPEPPEVSEPIAAVPIEPPAPAVAQPVVSELPEPAPVEAELFFGDETLDEITHEPTTAPDELELGIVPQEAIRTPEVTPLPDPSERVIEATEPSVASALSLDIAEPSVSPAVEEPSPAATDVNLSDTSFGRQVEEFAAESPDPIVEPAVAEEESPVEISSEELPWDLPVAEANEPTISDVESIESPQSPSDPFETIEHIEPLATESAPSEEAPLNWDEAPLIAEPVSPSEEPASAAEPVLPVDEQAEPADPKKSLFRDSTTSIEPESAATMEAVAPPQAISEPQTESTFASTSTLVPGMPLDFSAPMMPDFVTGLPLVLDELPGPPPSFGRVQVGFGGKEMPRARIDTLRDKTGEAGPFDNLQIDIDNPVPLAPPPAQLPVDDVPLDELEEVVEPEQLIELPAEPQPQFDKLEVVPEPMVEAPVAETPAPVEEIAVEPEPEVIPEAPVPVEQATGEVAPEITPEVTPEAEIAPQPPPVVEPPKNKPLFQGKVRIPPPPRRMRLEPKDEQPQVEPPAGFESPESGTAFGGGGFGQASQPFNGLVGAVASSADVFSQGFSADLSNDPIFGSAVKPVEPPPVQPTRRKAATTPARPGRRAAEVTPAQEEMAAKLAEELGAPPLAEVPPIQSGPSAVVAEVPVEETVVAEELPQPAELVEEEQPVAAPRTEYTLSTQVAAPQMVRRGGKRVAVLLAVMVILMAAAAGIIYRFCQQRVAFTGSISYENFGNLQQAEQVRLQESQKSLLVSERARDVALNDFRSHHLDLSPGFLADAEDFARNEGRVKWAESHPGGGYDTLVYRYEGSDKNDEKRVAAVLDALYQLDQEMVGDADKARASLQQNRETLDAKQRELAILEAQRKDINEKMSRLPDDEQLRALKADNETAEKSFRTAFDAARAAEAALKSLEQPPSQISAVSNAPADPELQELQKSLDDMKNKLATAQNTVEEHADMARKGLDNAIEEFQKSTSLAEGLMKDNPELSAFVAQAQKLQETVQKLTGDLLDRQQKSYEKQVEEKRFIENRLTQRRKELWDSDKDMKRVKDDLAMRERGYNAAVGQGYDKEAAEIKKELDAGLAQVEKRKMELESDPMLMTLTDLLARSQEEIASAQKQLEQDRKQADALTEELQKNFAHLEPDVQKLPQSQRNLAQQMTSRMDAVNNARRTLADAVEAKNVDANAALKMLEDQTQILAGKIEDRRKALAVLNSQQLPAEERQKQQANTEQKRAAYAAAVKAEADAENGLLKKRQALLDAQANAADGAKARDQYEKVTRQYFDLRDKELPQLKASLEQAEQMAGISAYPSKPSNFSSMQLADPRLTYTALAIAAIAIAFSLLIIFTGSTAGQMPLPMPPIAARMPSIAATPLPEPLGGIGLKDVGEAAHLALPPAEDSRPVEHSMPSDHSTEASAAA